jgi:hypothetical protein
LDFPFPIGPHNRDLNYLSALCRPFHRSSILFKSAI